MSFATRSIHSGKTLSGNTPRTGVVSVPAAAAIWSDIFLLHEGTNDIAWGLIAFNSLASYERYRARLRSDKEARENFATAQTRRFILREERRFAEVVDGTFGIPSALAGAE